MAGPHIASPSSLRGAAIALGVAFLITLAIAGGIAFYVLVYEPSQTDK